MSLFAKKKTEEVKAPQEEKKAVEPAPVPEAPKELPPEKTFLLDRRVQCVVCDQTFTSKSVKSKAAIRLDSDLDLRPRYKQLDTLKYDVYACPYCGYAALSPNFEHLTAGQIKLVKDNVAAKLPPITDASERDCYDYNIAIERFQRALICSVAKKGKASEISYTCLKLAWLYRGMAEELDTSAADYDQKLKTYKEQEEAYYSKAYDGLLEAVASENYPICGMDQCTLDYLLATMAFHFKKYDTASKCISNIQASPFATKRIKDKTLDLKNMILEERKREREEAENT